MAKLPTDTSAAALSAALAAPAPEKDEFADAFAGFANPETAQSAEVKAAEDAAAKLAATTEGATTADEPGTEIEGAPDPAAGEEKTPEELAAEAKAAEDAAKAAEKPAENKTADDALARLADILSQREQPKPQIEQPKPAAPAPLYTNDEVTQLQAFYKEWPEVAPAVQTLLKGAMTSVTNHIFAEVARNLAPKLQLLDQMADNMMLAQVKQAVPDFDDTLADRVNEWVQTQPKYLQAAYTSVMQHGTSDDISDLVKRYRQETGTAAEGDRTTNGTQEQPPAKQAASLSPAAKKAAAALAPVNSKRTGNTQIEPQTFDEAFDVFAKAG